MKGFIISNAFELENQASKPNFSSEKKTWEDIQMTRTTAKKFANDKVFYETTSYVVLIEGIIFNSERLKTQYQTEILAEALVAMYEEAATFFTELDGSFSGYLLDKNQEKLIVFANKIGDHPVFYWQKNGKYVIATSVKAITQLLQAHGIECKLDKIGCYCLLTHGWMLQNVTLIDGIQRIGAGEYLVSDGSYLNRYKYHEFSNQPQCEEQTEIDMIEKLDFFFKKALQKLIDKNNEYGYRHVAQLSAGLDSRTVNYGLAALQITEVINVSYSESDYYDQKIPMQIAGELKHEWLFKSLDNGDSLFLLEEIVKRNDGLVLHYGPAQVWDMFANLEREQFGIIYNGIAGDVVAGDYCTENNPLRQGALSDEVTSKKLLDRLEVAIAEANYEIDYRMNQEMFLYYNSCFTGSTMGTPLTLQYDCESYSPFYDEDFFSYCLSIPLQKRWDYNLYDKWLMQKYPGATKYLHNGERKIGTHNNIEIFGKRTNIYQLPKKTLALFMRKTGLKKEKIQTKDHMNPLDYWYHNNQGIAEFMDQYFTEEIQQLSAYPEIQRDCHYLYQEGNVIEKTQVLTLLAATKHLLGDVKNEKTTK